MQVRENAQMPIDEFADLLCEYIDELHYFFSDGSEESKAATHDIMCLL